MEGGTDHKSPGGASMLYDVTILTVRPGTTPKALPQLDQWLRGTRLGGTLLACWLTEIGALNQILLIREYGSEPAIAADRDAIVRSGNPYGVADMITAASCDTYVSFPFLSPMQAGSAGPIFEVRTYVLKPAGLGKTIELWRAAVQNRVKALAVARGHVLAERRRAALHAHLALCEPRRAPAHPRRGRQDRGMASARRPRSPARPTGRHLSSGTILSNSLAALAKQI